MINESEKIIILRSLSFYQNYLKSLLSKGDDAISYDEILDLIVKVESVIKGLK